MMLRFLHISALLGLIGLGLGACAKDEQPPPEGALVQGPAEVCDAGDEAFVRRIVPLLWGRQPTSVRELDVLVQIAGQVGRDGLVRHMARSPEFNTRWLEWMKDIHAVNRTGVRANVGCQGDPLLPDVAPDLAGFVRGNAPLHTDYGPTWNMTDLMRSALAADDLSAIWVAQLFATNGQVPLPAIEGDGNLIGEELNNRRNQATIFQNAYLHRSLVCMGCHNSAYAITDSLDPALDRHWPLQGLLERALFGADDGRPLNDLLAYFRTGGVLSVYEVPNPNAPLPDWFLGEGVQPWGAVRDCGVFVEPSELTPDPFEMAGWFIEPSERPSVWVMSQMLSEGFDALQKEGLHIAADNTVDGREALAWMVSLNIADIVWQEMTGRRLTLVNFFPRNQIQRDTLRELADAFVSNHYSLVELLVAITQNPYFNHARPVQCGGPDVDYFMPTVFNPWTPDLDVPESRSNGVGDLVRRYSPRVLMRSVTTALGWAAPPEFFLGGDEGFVLPPAGVFQRDIGVFLKDTETGFRGTDFKGSLAWEEVYGTCRDPAGTTDDFVSALVAASDAKTTLADGISALKDRLLADPRLVDEDEQALLEALTDAPLETPLSELPEADATLRRVCGLFLSTPQFLLSGAPGPDLIGQTTGLVVPGTEFESYCEALASALFEPGQMSCGKDHLTIEQK